MPNPFPPSPAGPPIPQFGGFVVTQLAYGTPGFTITGIPTGCGCGCGGAGGGCGGDCGCGCSGAGGSDSCGDATPLTIGSEADPGAPLGAPPDARPAYQANGGGDLLDRAASEIYRVPLPEMIAAFAG